jgi:hypothetical protein
MNSKGTQTIKVLQKHAQLFKVRNADYEQPHHAIVSALSRGNGWVVVWKRMRLIRTAQALKSASSPSSSSRQTLAQYYVKGTRWMDVCN